MKISIDLDGVVADFSHAANEVINVLWPGRIPANHEPSDWYWSDVLKKEEWGQIFKVIKSIPNFWESRRAYPENIMALRLFLTEEENHEVYYVTSRAETAGRALARQCENWLSSFNVWPQFNYQGIIPIKEGTPAEAKKAMMSALGIEMSIDDYGPTVEMCNTIPGHRAYVLDRSWNRDKDYGPRLYSLQEYFELVKLGRAN